MHVKTVVYRPQANRTKRLNRDLVQMIANYVKDQHDTWDQFSRAGLKNDQERHTSIASNRRPLVRPPPGSWSEPNRKVKRGRKETLAYKRSFKCGSGGPERKNRKGTGHKVDKRTLSLNNSNDLTQFRKIFRTEETIMSSTSGYNLRPRGGAKVKSRPANVKRTQQEGPV
ncbi:uncharacterized protein TNCV_1936151 [Trichonephila clavipes]|nr:uncharacterized protein TNCV_1936151 [Trichonephila clavipes]